MKLLAELNNENHTVELKRDGEKVWAKVDEREYELEVSQVEPNLYFFKQNNHIFQIYLSPNGIVNIGNNQFEIKLIDPKKLRGTGQSEVDAQGTIEIKTAMPGKIVRILVEEGATVAHGDGVIIVEAMKMQNEMKSPKEGVIKTIRVEEGSTVNAGEVLVVIE